MRRSSLRAGAHASRFSTRTRTRARPWPVAVRRAPNPREAAPKRRRMKVPPPASTEWTPTRDRSWCGSGDSSSHEQQRTPGAAGRARVEGGVSEVASTAEPKQDARGASSFASPRGLAAAVAALLLSSAARADVAARRRASGSTRSRGRAPREIGPFGRHVQLACDALGGACQVAASEKQAEYRATLACEAPESWQLELQRIDGTEESSSASRSTAIARRASARPRSGRRTRASREPPPRKLTARRGRRAASPARRARRRAACRRRRAAAPERAASSSARRRAAPRRRARLRRADAPG